MKPIRHKLSPTPARAVEAIAPLAHLWAVACRQKLPIYLFLALCFNLVVAPVVYASSGGDLSRPQAWALALLGLATIAVSIYLFIVMFSPEKF